MSSKHLHNIYYLPSNQRFLPGVINNRKYCTHTLNNKLCNMSVDLSAFVQAVGSRLGNISSKYPSDIPQPFTRCFYPKRLAGEAGNN